MRIEEIVSGIKEVAPLPKAYIRIQELVNDPNSSFHDVTEVISNDPGLTSRVLRIANSAYMGLVTKCDTISRAVQVLGLNQVHDLALASAAVGSLTRMESKALDIYDFWRRSIYCASVSRLLARKVKHRAADRLFVGGLLHDVGSLVLAYKDPLLYSELLAASKRGKVPLATIEREQLGFDYAAISAELMTQWQLPADLREAVGCHTGNLSLAPPENWRDTAIIHVGAVVSRAAMWHSDDDEPVPDFDPVATQLVDLSDAFVEELMIEADAIVVEAMSLLLPDLKGRGPGKRTERSVA
jgi:HD-like signal output (HDOD) protein